MVPPPVNEEVPFIHVVEDAKFVSIKIISSLVTETVMMYRWPLLPRSGGLLSQLHNGNSVNGSK